MVASVFDEVEGLVRITACFFGGYKPLSSVPLSGTIVFTRSSRISAVHQPS